MRISLICLLLVLSFPSAYADESNCDPPIMVIEKEKAAATKFDTGGMQFLWFNSSSLPKSAVFVSKTYQDTAGALKKFNQFDRSPYYDQITAIAKGWKPSYPGQAQVIVTFAATGELETSIYCFIPAEGADGKIINEEVNPEIKELF